MVRRSTVAEPDVDKLGIVARLPDHSLCAPDCHSASEAVVLVELACFRGSRSTRRTAIGLGLAHGLQMTHLPTLATFLALLWALGLDMALLAATVASDLAPVISTRNFVTPFTVTSALVVTAATSATAASAAAAFSSRIFVTPSVASRV